MRMVTLSTTPCEILLIRALRVFVFGIAIALLCFGTAIVGQAQNDDETIRTTVSLVQLNVGVVDRQGRAVTSLSRGDFAVYEDGVKQSISSFEPAFAPFSLVLLL